MAVHKRNLKERDRPACPVITPEAGQLGATAVPARHRTSDRTVLGVKEPG